MASLRARIRSDLLALGSLSFMAGTFAIATRVLGGGELFEWVFAATAVACVGAAIFVGRRIISRIP
jgi:hypothetical protein